MYEKDKAGIVLEAGEAGDQRAFEPGRIRDRSGALR